MQNVAGQKQVVVIGAGLGGLSAAISLASEGFSVTLIEKNDKVGGKLNILKKDGFTFDLGPSILTMPEIFDQLFARAGRKRDDYVTFEAVTPHWRNFFEDGTIVDLSPDATIQRREFDKLGDNVYSEFCAFMAYAQKLSDETQAGYFEKGIDGVWALLKFYGLKRSLNFDIFSTMDQGVRRFVHDPKLIDILNYFIKYVGASPYEAPALMNLLPSIQYQYGLWYVRGGMYALAQAMEKLAIELGVNIRLNTEVERIEHHHDILTGVCLKNGDTISADIVVSNMEVIPAMRSLLQSTESEINKMRRFKPSCSGLVMHLGVDCLYPQLAHHNFFYSENSRAHFTSVFKKGDLSQDPTIYLVAPCKTDANQAPKGGEVIKILPHIPSLNPDKPISDAQYYAMRERVLIKLERMGLTNLREHIVTEEFWTPNDIAARYYSNQGSIYGVEANQRLNLGFKAPQRSDKLKNLYFVGGSVNPGGGMPMVTLSGQLVCDKILLDLKINTR